MIAAVVLAAGQSKRFGAAKLVAPFRGRPLIHHAIDGALQAPIDHLVIVARPDPALRNVLRGYEPTEPPFEVLEFDSSSLSASLMAGIEHMKSADAAFVFLGDMPLVPPWVAARLLSRIGDCLVAAPQFQGRRGHPALLSRKAFPLLQSSGEDEGARRLFDSPNAALIDVDDDAILFDVDRPDDMMSAKSQS